MAVVLIAGTTAWAAILQAEQRVLLRILTRTEDALGRERASAALADVEHRHQLNILREREAYQRLLLDDEHRSAVQAVVYEGFKAQMTVLDMRCGNMGMGRAKPRDLAS